MTRTKAVLLLALPLLLIAMIATWLETPGSPLFLQERVGRDGRSFRIVKLRTMFTGNDDRGKVNLAGIVRR